MLSSWEVYEMGRWVFPVLLTVLGAAGLVLAVYRPPLRTVAFCQKYLLDQARFFGVVADLKLRTTRELEVLEGQDDSRRAKTELRRAFLKSKLDNLEAAAALVADQVGRIGADYSCTDPGLLMLQTGLDYPTFSDLLHDTGDMTLTARELRALMKHLDTPKYDWLKIGGFIISAITLLLGFWKAAQEWGAQRRARAKDDSRIVRPK